MHYIGYVIGEDFESQLEPFDENLEVDEYKDYLSEEYVDPTEIGKTVFKDENGYYELLTYNPKTHWDWYSVGGRWSGYFEIKEHAVQNYDIDFICFNKKENIKKTYGDSVYRKDIVDFESKIPYFVLINGDWISKDMFYSKYEYIGSDGEITWDYDRIDKEWKEYVVNTIYPKIKDGDLVTAIDIHI